MDKSRNSVEARRLCRKGIALIFPASISNRKDGFQLLRKAAALGSIDAHEWLGAAYHYGLGTRVNRSLAFKHDLITAKAGRANGEYHVGIAYDTGSGVRANQKLAIKWLRRAAKHDKYSMNVLRQVLGKAYRCGWGVKKNVKKGFARLGGFLRKQIPRLRQKAPIGLGMTSCFFLVESRQRNVVIGKASRA